MSSLVTSYSRLSFVLIDTPQFIQSVPWLLNSLDWFQAFRILWEYVFRIGVYTLDSAGKFFWSFFFGNNCLLICPLLAFQARRALEWEAPCFISCFTLKRGATSPAPAPNLGPLLQCPFSSWVVSASALSLRPYSSVHSMKFGRWKWYRESAHPSQWREVPGRMVAN